MPTGEKAPYCEINGCSVVAFLLLLATVTWVAVGLGLGFVRFDFWQFDPRSWTTPLAVFLVLLIICVSLAHRLFGLLREYNDAVVAHAEKALALRRDKEAELTAREEESERLRRLLEANVRALQTNERAIAEAHQKLTETSTDFEGLSQFAADVERRVTEMLEESSRQAEAAKELKAKHDSLYSAAAEHRAELTHHIAAVRDACGLPKHSQSDENVAKEEDLRMAASRETWDTSSVSRSPPFTNFKRADHDKIHEQNLALMLVLRDQESELSATQHQVTLLENEHAWVNEKLSKEVRKVGKLQSRTERYGARLQMFKQMEALISESHSMLETCQENISKERTVQVEVQQRLSHEKNRSQFLLRLLQGLQAYLQSTGGDSHAFSDKTFLSLMHGLGSQEDNHLSPSPSPVLDHDV